MMSTLNLDGKGFCDAHYATSSHSSNKNTECGSLVLCVCGVMFSLESLIRSREQRSANVKAVRLMASGPLHIKAVMEPGVIKGP